MNRIIQSLALAFLYKETWPFLLIIPLFLKPLWIEKLSFYLSIAKEQIQWLNEANQPISLLAKVIMISFETASKAIKQKADFLYKTPLFAIVDEILLISDPKCLKTRFFIPILMKTKHLVLLSTRLDLKQPKQLFTAVQCLKPGLFKDFESFGKRYCDPKPSLWGLYNDYSGCSNETELFYWLNEGFLIGNKRENVLSELPLVNREIIPLSIDPAFESYYNGISKGFFTNDNRAEIYR